MSTGKRTVITGRLQLRRPEKPPRPPSRRPARVAQLLALAHRWQRELDGGVAESQAAIARREGITSARVSQVMGLLNLAPDLQEWVLGLEAVDGVEPLREREVRVLARTSSWPEQRSEAAPPQATPTRSRSQSNMGEGRTTVSRLPVNQSRRVRLVEVPG